MLADTLNFSLSTAPSGMTIDATTGLIKWTPTFAQLGGHTVAIEVRDSFGTLTTQSYTLTVASPVSTTSVPNIIGGTRATGISTLIAAKLNIGSVIFEHSNTVTSGIIMQAAPSVNTVVEEGTAVDLVISLGAVTGLPPDPGVVATPLDTTAPVTPIDEASKFLYTGSNPIQTGMVDGTIDAKRIAVLSGKVLTRDSQPLPGVKVTVKDHPEFGQTLSRTDGQYDLAVNGGGILTLNYQKANFLPVQRQVKTPWQDYVSAEDVALNPVDTQVATIDLTANTLQVAQGSLSTDTDGQRQATVLFPVGTQATMTLPDGSTQALTNLHVRATEYTVGENGPKAMPGALPTFSGYTYAVELSVDEALAADATRVNFNQPLPMYVDNFIDFPVGEIVPAGWYDRNKASWIPSDNGKVIKIIGVDALGLAELDTNGSGQPADSAMLTELGITDPERTRLAGLYPVGKSLWRVPISHFTPWDCNWPFGPPANAKYPPDEKPKSPDENNPDTDESDNCTGCSINAQSQTLGEKIAVTGTPFNMHYSSDRVADRSGSAQSIKIPLTTDQPIADLKRIELIIQIAGQVFKKQFPNLPNQRYTYEWNGKDIYDRPLSGRHVATVDIAYVYQVQYYSSRIGFCECLFPAKRGSRNWCINRDRRKSR